MTTFAEAKRKADEKLAARLKAAQEAGKVSKKKHIPSRVGTAGNKYHFKD